MTEADTNFAKKPRGFAALSPEKRREIAAKGGAAVPAEKRTFSISAEKAAAAGRKGGKNVDPKKRSFSQNLQLASEAGRAGGLASHRNKR